MGPRRPAAPIEVKVGPGLQPRPGCCDRPRDSQLQVGAVAWGRASSRVGWRYVLLAIRSFKLEVARRL